MVNHMRHTRAHTGNRRSHHALKKGNFVLCSECGAPKLNHAICANCGKYNKKLVVDVKAIVAKREKRTKERLKAAGK